jgi:hypothetical protein
MNFKGLISEVEVICSLCSSRQKCMAEMSKGRWWMMQCRDAQIRAEEGEGLGNIHPLWTLAGEGREIMRPSISNVCFASTATVTLFA